MSMSKLRSLMLKPCSNTFNVPYNTTQYSHVLSMWKHYKKGYLNKNDTLINSIFSFREKHDNHVIIYSSVKIPNSVLMLGKVDGKYVNINIPWQFNIKKSFVAVYA